MSKNLLIILVAIAVGLGGVIVANYGLLSKAGQPAASGEVIEIKDYTYTPAILKVKPGQTITVTNRDVAAHTVTSDNETSFDTGLLGKDQSGTITAPTLPGSYPYH